ncbi:MAG: YraN family protein [Candidatus Limnocylindrales bacterium]
MSSKTVRRRHGDRAEAIAGAYLERLGWHVLEHNVRVGRDEVDLLALDPGPPPNLVAVEVRGRAVGRFGLPEESVDRAKVRRCYRAAGALRRAGQLADGTHLPSLPWRVDLITVDLDPALGPGLGGPRLRHLRALEPA